MSLSPYKKRFTCHSCGVLFDYNVPDHLLEEALKQKKVPCVLCTGTNVSLDTEKRAF